MLGRVEKLPTFITGRNVNGFAGSQAVPVVLVKVGWKQEGASQYEEDMVVAS
jgi:hypothetical protein